MVWLSCPCPKLTIPAYRQPASTEPVLLTGVSAGIGEELAYHYARLGSHLVLTAHTEALLQQVRHSISSRGGSGGTD